MPEKETRKKLFSCKECSARSLQWSGQCIHCSAWNSLVEIEKPSSQNRYLNKNIVQKLNSITSGQQARTRTNIAELDRVLGGGVVPGSVILLGGDPGIGKSTLALQWLVAQHPAVKSLYVSGEESIQQILLRAKRLGLDNTPIDLVSENRLEVVIEILPNYEMIVIDSIQALHAEGISSVSGSISQVREVADHLTRCAKANGVSVLIIGHVTKEGSIAGPKVLEHMVDTVLYFEGDASSRFRLIRSFKNRFGSINEIGVFFITETGLKEISSPSVMFLSGRNREAPGSVVLVAYEGNRSLLVEVQGLLDKTNLSNPRRLCVGLDSQRVILLLAILQRHGGISISDQDVFVNVAGGLKVSESGADVAIVSAIISSLTNKPFPADTVCFGEIGLAGEIRPVQRGEERLHEAAKLGFKRALLPDGNKVSERPPKMEIVRVKEIGEIIEWLV